MASSKTFSGSLSSSANRFLRFRESLGQEIERLSDKGLTPLLAIVFTFWIVCLVEWTQRFAGALPDPRFWTLLSLGITIYGGVHVFRLSPRLNQRARASQAALRLNEFLSGITSKSFVVYAGSSDAGFNVDHVLVGPSGLFAVEVMDRARFGSRVIECQEDKLLMGGRIWDAQPVRQVRDTVESLRRQLETHPSASCPINGLVVFLDDWEIRAGALASDIAVLTANQLNDYFEQQPAQLSSDEISSVCSCLEAAGPPAVQ